jgi:hypothetical protein
VGDKLHLDGTGELQRYDVYVAGAKVGSTIRFITTDAALRLGGDGTVVRSGMLSKAHPEASEIKFPNGERMVLDGIVIAVGYTAPVFVDFNGGNKTYSVSKYDRTELAAIDTALGHLSVKEHDLLQSALSLSFE